MITVKNLTKYYQSHCVLDDMSLEIPQGKTVVILGRSGVGKSVFLKHLLGLEKPNSGEIIVDGHPITQLKQSELYQAVRQMGMLFQGGALFDSMTVFENVGFYLLHHTKEPLSVIEDRVQHALQMVDMDGSQEKMPAELSGGMKKRVALARLIVYRPKTLLYDEPTTGLDPITSMNINNLLIKTQQELEATSIVVTHDIASALTVGDYLALLEKGKIVVMCEKKDFMSQDHPSIKAFLSYLHPKGTINE